MSTDTNNLLVLAEKYFNRRAIDDNDLKKAIPELLSVIKDLTTLRNSVDRTDNYINNWRNSKVKQCVVLEIDGVPTEVDLAPEAWDMTKHDRYINWLFAFFYKLYTDKTGETISYAFALDILTVYHNQQILSKRLILENIIDRPNTNIDDVFDAIEQEANVIVTENTDSKALDFSADSRIYTKLLENYNFWKDIQSSIQHGKGKNIFLNISEREFILMVEEADFSKALNVRGQTQRVRYNVIVLGRILGEAWQKKALKNLGTTFEEAGKASSFEEYEHLKKMYM